MTDNESTSPESTPEATEASPEETAPETEEASSATEEAGGSTGPAREPAKPKSKDQPILVWLGIACLLLAAFVGWRAAERKKWFRPVAERLSEPVIQEGQVMEEWATKLRQQGGPHCKAIAEMILDEQLPPLLEQRGITNLEELAVALLETGRGSLSHICEKELSGSYNRIAWILAVVGICLILLDVLKERGMLSGRKKS